ncbi:hypothetical protein HBH97_246280 [Parastagonospora nodorum]|nr:hypothetical protein HBH97_246280 [Parastagonospora nodorum]
MSQTNVREGYRIITLEVIKLIEDLISYLTVAKYTQLRNAQIPKVFYEAAVRQYSAKVKTENLSNTLTLTLSKTAQRQSSSVVSNRSTALITNKFSVALLTKPAILNNANITLVDAVHHSIVIDALTITLIKDNDDLLDTVNSYIKPPLKRCKTKAADSRHAKASRRRTKKDKDLENSNTSSDVLRLRRRDRAAACAQSAKRKHLLDSDDYCLDSSLDINPKDNSEDEEATTAKNLAREQKERLKALLNAKTRDSLSARTEVQNTQVEGNATEYNAVNDNNKLYPTKGERTFYYADPLALQFCFFSNSPLENIGRLIKEEIILEANMPAVHSKATKHRLALSAARFIIVCGFRKVDKHMFRAYNTISVTAQRTIIRKGSPYIEKRVILLPNFLSTVQNAKQQCRDILEKEGLNKLEASRRVIFNCFKMQAIAFYPALTTLKAAQFKIYSSCKVKRFTSNSVKNLFTNLSKDYFLVQEARAITKSSLNIAAEDAAKAANILLLLKKVCAKILIESYKLIVQALAEIYISIVYFNLDSELELKVLGKQDVKTTS